MESADDQVRDEGCGQHAEQHDHRRSERQDGRYGARYTAGFLLVFLGQQLRVNGNKRGREHALAEQRLQHVGDAERRAPRGGYRGEPEHSRKNPLADKSDEPREQDSGGHQHGMPAGAFALFERGHLSELLQHGGAHFLRTAVASQVRRAHLSIGEHRGDRGLHFPRGVGNA